MPKNTNENEILSKLEYIGLDLEEVPDFLKEAKKFEYRPLKSVEENTYKVYKYIPISKIQILLTPCNRLNSIQEKYSKADSISSYLDSKSEESILKYTTFLKMLNKVEISKIESILQEQKKLTKQVPFLVKYNENYLWQIYYSDIADTYFMLVPTEDLDYAAFFYLLKKQIELKNSKKEEWLFVPISHEEYSSEYLKKSQIADMEKYLWQFTKNWPITYEVYDKKQNVSIHIVGQVAVYENMQSEYKVKLDSKEEAEKFYKFLKALFILSVELPHYYNFQIKINSQGGLEFEYNNKKITYDGLMELLNKEYKKAKKEIEDLQKQEFKLEQKLELLKKEGVKKEQEYLTKERQIATYLECKKTFLGKVKYFFKAKKLKKNMKQKLQQDDIKEQEEVQEVIKEQKNQFTKKEYYTIEDIIQISKELDAIAQNVKNLQLDIKAGERKIESLTKKIENATLYIEEIDEHEKSIFEFWKFASKDEQALLVAPQEESVQDKRLEKVFDYEEDIEEIAAIIDKKQRRIFSKQETDAIYIATTKVLSILNDIENEELFKQSLDDLKQKAEDERILFNQENFDFFGNVASDNSKIQLLAGKKHRESKKDELKILEITKNLSLEDYQEKILDIKNDILEAFKKSSSPVSIPVYQVSKDKLEDECMQVFSIKPEEVLKENEDKKEINLYRLNVKENMQAIYFTNNIYYDNHNKTLPLGMDITTKCLINMSDYELTLIKKDNFRVINLEDEFKIKTTKINVFEYDIKHKEEL